MSAALAFVQRGENAHDAKHAAAEIADGNPGPHRMLAVRPGDRHTATGGLRHLVKGGTIGPRSLRAVAGHCAGDDARIDAAQCVEIQAQALRHPGGKIAQDNIGFFHQPLEQLHTARRFQVDRHAFLVAVEGEEVGAHAAEGIVRIAGQQRAGALPLQRLHLDRLRAQIGENHSGIRPGQHMCQVQYAHASQWFVHLAISVRPCSH